MSKPVESIEVEGSRGFVDWLESANLSLGVTTYQTGKLLLIGRKPGGRIGVFERTFARAMGAWADASSETLWMASSFQIWRFANVLAAGQTDRGYDRLYVPRVGYTTGDLDVHDLAEGADGRPVFVSTSYSCLATLSDRHGFLPLWRPRFISRLAPEDRCHLNGLAMVDGRPRYVTACSRSDVVDGWREGRVGGGALIDVGTGEEVLGGLSMPHSPRVFAGRTWLLDSGTGRFGFVDVARGSFEEVAFCPGYARGLAVHGGLAIVGLSRPRRGERFSGLPLDDALTARGAAARSGLIVVDLASGNVVHWLRIGGSVSELYDVFALPGVSRPTALGFRTDEVRYLVTIEGEGGLWRGDPAQPRSTTPGIPGLMPPDGPRPG